MDLRPELSIVNKQLLEAAFYGTLSETVEDSDEKIHSNPSKDNPAEGGEEEPSNSQEWTEEQLVQLEKAVQTVIKRRKAPPLAYHAIQGLREARLIGWSCKTAPSKKKGPPKAEKHSPDFWKDVAEIVTSPEKYGIKRNGDECIDAYVGRLDPDMHGTVLEKLILAGADVNAVDKVKHSSTKIPCSLSELCLSWQNGISALHYAAKGSASGDSYLQDVLILLRQKADPMVADISGNTPLHFFAIAAAEDCSISNGEKKGDKDKKSKMKLKAKEKRHAALLEALGCNLKCCNW
jgi:hypothetical protein